MNKVVACFFGSALLVSGRADASGPQECQVQVLTPILDDLGNVWKAGSVVPVDVERVGLSSKAFCAHGGSCLPRTVHAQPALMLLNCKVGPALGGGDFRLVPDARQASPGLAAKLKMLQYTTAKLMDLGFSNASSATLAIAFTNHSRSSDGRLVAEALRGSQSALATLKRNNP